MGIDDPVGGDTQRLESAFDFDLHVEGDERRFEEDLHGRFGHADPIPPGHRGRCQGGRRGWRKVSGLTASQGPEDL
ncbi:MAG: hypothetical protein A2135_03430 [Actinobacteria bacterium RBG_16_67_15]|nr:MAG: hypothetical protein A2135_03430 [Actinobacteria bacterium RBG_16_67_15]